MEPIWYQITLLDDYGKEMVRSDPSILQVLSIFIQVRYFRPH